MDSRTYVADFWIVLVVGVFVWSVLFGVASGAIRKHQGGRFGNGFAWGFFLGFIGLIVVLATRPERPPTVIYVQSPTSPVQHVPQVRVAAENGYVPEPRRSASRRHPMPFSAWFALGLLLAIGVVSLINSVQDTSSTPRAAASASLTESPSASATLVRSKRCRYDDCSYAYMNFYRITLTNPRPTPAQFWVTEMNCGNLVSVPPFGGKTVGADNAVVGGGYFGGIHVYLLPPDSVLESCAEMSNAGQEILRVP